MNIILITICRVLSTCQAFQSTIVMIEANCKNNAILIVFKCIQDLSGISIVACAIRDQNEDFLLIAIRETLISKKCLDAFFYTCSSTANIFICYFEEISF